MKWGPRAYSAQFHFEVEHDTVTNWAAIPEYQAALEKAMGAEGAAQLRQDVADNLKSFNDMAERVYINWLQTAAQT